MNGVATNIIHLQHKKLKYYGGVTLCTGNPSYSATNADLPSGNEGNPTII